MLKRIKEFYLLPQDVVTEIRPINFPRIFLTVFLSIMGIAILAGISIFFFPKKESQQNTLPQAESTATPIKEKVHPRSYYHRPSQSNQNFNTSQLINRNDTGNLNRHEYIPLGSSLLATLSTKIVSNQLGSPVIAVTTHDFDYQENLAIPTGTKLIGIANHDEEARKIHVTFHHFVLPNGQQYSIQALALDPLDDGSEGLSGEYHSNEWKKVTGSLLGTFVGGVASGMENRTFSKNKFKSAMYHGLSLSALEQAKRYATQIENTKGFITVEKDYPIIVFLTQEQKIPDAEWE